MRPDRILLLACASLASAWAWPAYAGQAQASFPVHIRLANPRFSVTATGITSIPANSGLCTSGSAAAPDGVVVTIACESSQFVSLERVPGNPFLDADRNADRFILHPDRETSPDDPAWPGAGTVTTMQVYYRNTSERTEIRVNF